MAPNRFFKNWLKWNFSKVRKKGKFVTIRRVIFDDFIFFVLCKKNMEKSFANTDRRKQVSKNRSKNTRKITFFWTTYETVFKDDFLDFLCSKRYRFGEISDGRWLCWNTFFSKMSSENTQNRCGPSETHIQNMHKLCIKNIIYSPNFIKFVQFWASNWFPQG